MFKELFKRLTAKSEPAPAPEPVIIPPKPADEVANDFRQGRIDSATATAEMARGIADEKNIDQVFGKGETTLMKVCSRAGGAKMAQMLIDAGANVNWAKEDGETPLQRAAQSVDPETMRVLLDAGADVKKFRTGPPRFAFGDGELPGKESDVFEDVIINRLDETDDMKAARRECLKLLLDRGHTPSERDMFSVYVNRPHLRSLFPGIEEARAITYAAEEGNAEKVEEMLAKGVKPDAAAAYGANTALIEAIGAGHTEIAKRLIEAGADITLKSPQHNVMPLDKAIGCENKEMFDFLLERGVDPKDPRHYSIQRMYNTSEWGRPCGPEMKDYVLTKLAARELTLQKPVSVSKPLKLAKPAISA